MSGFPPTSPSSQASCGQLFMIPQHLRVLFPLGTEYRIVLFPDFSPQALQNIAKTWSVIQLDIVPYKDKGHHRLR